MSAQDRIKDQISKDSIVLYMKGTPQFPQCGFSSQSAQILKACGAEFASYDVLTDPEIRQGVKDYANWPTIPQLYINGEFVGGCDIMTDLYNSGELQKMVDAAK